MPNHLPTLKHIKKRHVVKTKLQKPAFDKFEKACVVCLSVFLICFAFKYISNANAITEVSSQDRRLEAQRKVVQQDNDRLQTEIADITSPKNLAKIAKKHHLSYHQNQIINVK